MKGKAKTSKGFQGSNKQTSNNVANLATPKFGNNSKFQETPNQAAVNSRHPIKK